MSHILGAKENFAFGKAICNVLGVKADIRKTNTSSRTDGKTVYINLKAKTYQESLAEFGLMCHELAHIRSKSPQESERNMDKLRAEFPNRSDYEIHSALNVASDIVDEMFLEATIPYTAELFHLLRNMAIEGFNRDGGLYLACNGDITRIALTALYFRVRLPRRGTPHRKPRLRIFPASLPEEDKNLLVGTDVFVKTVNQCVNFYVRPEKDDPIKEAYDLAYRILELLPTQPEPQDPTPGVPDDQGETEALQRKQDNQGETEPGEDQNKSEKPGASGGEKAPEKTPEGSTHTSDSEPEKEPSSKPEKLPPVDIQSELETVIKKGSPASLSKSHLGQFDKDMYRKVLGPLRKYMDRIMETAHSTRYARRDISGTRRGKRWAPLFTDGRLFTRKDTGENRECNLGLLVDTSGSMEHSIASVAAVAKAICNVVQGMGGAVDIWSYNTSCSPVNPLLLSEGLHAFGGTAGSQALSNCIAWLKSRPTGRRILISLTDGAWTDSNQAQGIIHDECRPNRISFLMVGLGMHPHWEGIRSIFVSKNKPEALGLQIVQALGPEL